MKYSSMCLTCYFPHLNKTIIIHNPYNELRKREL